MNVITQDPRRPAHPVRGKLRKAAAWLGALNLIAVFAISVYNQFAISVPFTGPLGSPGQFRLGMAGLAAEAALAFIAGTVAILSGAVNRLQAALAVGVFGFIAGQALSAVIKSGFVPEHYLLQALGAAGLVLGTAAIPTRWSRRLLIGTSSLYGLVTLLGVFVFYTTHGAVFPYVVLSELNWHAHFTAGRPLPDPTPAINYDGRPFPTSMRDAFRSVAGLSTNGNLTGNYLMILTVYQVQHLASGLRRRGLAMNMGLLVLIAPPLLVFGLSNSRAAFVGAFVGLALALIPTSRLTGRASAGLFAIACLGFTTVPLVLARLGLVSLNGRDCIWRFFEDRVRLSPIWGLGPAPGDAATEGCGLQMTMAHNELLQGYVYGGLLGLASIVAIILGTGYVAWRGRALDGRALVAVAASASILFGAEVLSPWMTWREIPMGFAAFLAVASTSFGMMAPKRATPTPAAAEPEPDAPPGLEVPERL